MNKVLNVNYYKYTQLIHYILLTFCILYVKYILFFTSIVYLFALYEANRFIKDTRCSKFIQEETRHSYSNEFVMYELISDLYQRLRFNIIYAKVETGKYLNYRFSTARILTNLFCITFLGISKSGIKLIFLLIRHRSYDSIINYLASLLTIHGKTRRVAYLNGVWRLNGRHHLKLFSELKSGNFSNLQITKLTEVVKQYEEDQLKTFFCKTIVAEDLTIKNKSRHHYTIQILKDKSMAGIFTDEPKSHKAGYYNKEILLQGIELKKKTILLEQSVDTIVYKDNGWLIPSHTLIKAAYIQGYNPDKFIDQFNEEFFKIKFLLEEVDVTLADRDLFTEEEAKRAKEIIYNLNFFN